jgi:hypothetical protein
VLYQDKPVAGAVVSFHPRGGDPLKALRPSGVTDAEGVFHLTTGKDTGAPAGDYDVTVIWPAEPAKPAPGSKKVFSTSTDEPSPPDRLKGRYADPKTSSLSATVKTGRTQLEPFRLK